MIAARIGQRCGRGRAASLRQRRNWVPI